MLHIGAIDAFTSTQISAVPAGTKPSEASSSSSRLLLSGGRILRKLHLRLHMEIWKRFIEAIDGIWASARGLMYEVTIVFSVIS